MLFRIKHMLSGIETGAGYQGGAAAFPLVSNNTTANPRLNV